MAWRKYIANADRVGVTFSSRSIYTVPMTIPSFLSTRHNAYIMLTQCLRYNFAMTLYDQIFCWFYPASEWLIYHILTSDFQQPRRQECSDWNVVTKIVFTNKEDKQIKEKCWLNYKIRCTLYNFAAKGGPLTSHIAALNFTEAHR